MVREVVSATKLGIKIVLKQEILPNDKHFILALFVREDHCDDALNQTSRMPAKSKFILQHRKLNDCELRIKIYFHWY